MTRLILILLSIFISLTATGQAQSQISIGRQDSLYARTLREQRQLLIYLPPDYSTQKHYPVVYLLDAETHFHMFTGIVHHLGNYAIPEMIVVGILNVSRGRDYPPTHDADIYDTANGHGEVFTTFLERELIPYIDAHYATAPYRVLAGHSLGGLMVINTLLNHSSLFKAYLAIDPSLWWDRMKLVRQARTILAKNNRTNTSLFLGLSGIFPSERKEVAQRLKDTSGKTIDVRSVLLFKELLQQTSGNGLRWSSKSYPDEAHGSVPLPGYYDGLRFVFDFYKQPSLAILTDTTVRMLEHHYERVSQKMGYTILPPEYDLHGLAWRSEMLEKNFDRAHLFLLAYLRLYPNSPGAYESMGDYYDAKGDAKQAKHYYEQAKALDHISR